MLREPDNGEAGSGCESDLKGKVESAEDRSLGILRSQDNFFPSKRHPPRPKSAYIRPQYSAIRWGWPRSRHEGKMVRRVTLLVTAIGVAVLLASGIALAATLEGNDGPNTLVGTNGPDDIRGRGGDDNISGLGGIDRLRGDGGNDTVSGGPGGVPDRRERVEGNTGNDTLSGDEGADEVRGDSGNDSMLGGDGADLIRADDPGTDSVTAGSGDDVVVAHEDDGIDTIDCGDGIDLVRFDAGVDVVADNCERRDPH